MWKKLSLWIASNYRKIVNSIAFYPALIAILFLVLSFLFIAFDFSEPGKAFKSSLKWLSLKDATTTRSIISSIVSGIISLTVFSFTLVMIILNQTASQMSNRILDELIGNRFQQIVLGIYIGTIVFALFLLSTIRDIDSGIYIPALSTYFLILLTIVDIFLFIYFLHFITQSVKYEVIINRIYNETKKSMENCSTPAVEDEKETTPGSTFFINAPVAGIYEGFNKSALTELCFKNDCRMYAIRERGDFVFAGTPVMSTTYELPAEVVKDAGKALYLHQNESINNNFFYGFRQLTEVAIKALSPGINDPATAVQSMRALAKLFVYRLNHEPVNAVKDKDGSVRILTKELATAEMFNATFLPIWDYGKKDRIIVNEFNNLLPFMLSIKPLYPVQHLLNRAIEAKADQNK